MIDEAAAVADDDDAPESEERVPDTLREPSVYDRTMEAAKLRHFIAILREMNGNRSKTARVLGVNRRTVIRWIRDLKAGGKLT